ncbi:uncharacterized protein BXZ73DRAFT_32167, partial [Epithele typhae]|uniref:uncharacterized protein n=1 Tax=Epithele typhae TaxID=378194 RepID=UPI002008AC4D
AFIRLGYKYQMNDLRRRGLGCLKAHLEPRTEPWFFDCVLAPRLKPAYAPCIVNVARLTGELSLLPYTMMLCSKSVNPDYTGAYTYSDGKVEEINAGDRILCLQATPKLVLTTMSAVAAVVLP